MITWLDIKNLKYINKEQSIIDCEINFSHLPEEYVPFTLNSEDSEYHTQQIYQEIISGKWGNISPWIDPKSLDDYKNEKIKELNDLFYNKWTSPISYLNHIWHADEEAIQNIHGIVALILAGINIPNPRPWTPKDSLFSVNLTHQELIGLGAIIAQRKDLLYIVKKSKENEILNLMTTDDVLNYNLNNNW